ncbi:caspase family protein [Cognatiyoonia sp. IB215446]|uniref:caspase family protein n=1 Tax=Cognatiyoonia sp. IB215446 TaxID=3097355 RepID=UPI002A13F165|nr:caspase family protein [Cognatiyoonia sp. IB215446]MDX8347394.1 caspase family protein [Cognatiyoonia sp. IB215446]
MIRAALCSFAILAAAPVFAQPETPNFRYAIVVGNAEYEHMPALPNPDADADLVASFLEDAGYIVIQQNNLTRQGFEQFFRNVIQGLPDDSEVLFYYSGHGFQIGASNYLIPVDARISTQYDVPFQTMSLDTWIAAIAAKADLKLFILDSCRDNPFIGASVVDGPFSTQEVVETGFSSQVAPTNSIISFSTSPGAVAYDGIGDNSPYTGAFITEARSNPTTAIEAIFTSVREEVSFRTDGRQVPWSNSTLDGDIYFFVEDVPPPILDSDRPVISAGAGLDLPVTVNVTEAWDRNVRIGTQLADLEIDAALDTVTLRRAPENGLLTYTDVTRGLQLIGAEIEVALREGDTVPASALDRLSYSPRLSDLTDISQENPGRTDNLVFAAGDNQINVQVNLTVNACDIEAGAQLDPQGVGIEVTAEDMRIDLALEACRQAVEDFPETERFHYQFARALLAHKRYDDAKEHLERARDLGHIRAYTGLAGLETIQSAVAGGFQVGEAPASALANYETAAANGDALGAYGLGRQLLRFGESDVAKDRGYELLLRAFDAGYVQALNELGAYHFNENGGGYEPERGLRYFQEAAGRGSAFGYNNLGLIYTNGLGTIPRDLPLAIENLKAASDKSHPTAPTSLGRIYDGAEGFSADYQVAMEWYDLGLARGDPWGGANGAWIILNQTPDGYTNVDAAVRAAKAAALQNPDAAEQARNLLQPLSDRVLNAAAQTLLAEMGYLQSAIDGQFGTQSLSAYQQALDAYADIEAEREPQPRLISIARAYYKDPKFRVDTF